MPKYACVELKSFNIGTISTDNDLISFMNDILMGELRSKYWQFYRNNKQIHTTFAQLLKLPGSERAKILRNDPKLRALYTLKTQRA